MRYAKMRDKFPNDKKSKYYYVHRLIYMISHNVLEIANDAAMHVKHLFHVTLLQPCSFESRGMQCNAENQCFGHNWDGRAYQDYRLVCP